MQWFAKLRSIIQAKRRSRLMYYKDSHDVKTCPFFLEGRWKESYWNFLRVCMHCKKVVFACRKHHSSGYLNPFCKFSHDNLLRYIRWKGCDTSRLKKYGFYGHQVWRLQIFIVQLFNSSTICRFSSSSIVELKNAIQKAIHWIYTDVIHSTVKTVVTA